jgi:tripeptidyl-peptidase-1
MLPQIFFLAALTGFALASPLKKREVPGSYRLHERHLPHWSTQWTKRAKVPSTEVLPMRIGLKQSNLEAGREKLYDMWVKHSLWLFQTSILTRR